MFQDLKPYPAYIDANLPWVEIVPSHWGTARGKALFARMERPVRNQDGVVTCFRDGRVMLRSRRRTTGYTESLKEIGYQGIRRGDLVIHAMDAFAGAIGVAEDDGKSTPVYAASVPRAGASTRYYAHLVRRLALSGWIQANARGVRERSTDYRWASFAEERLPVPPREEQEAIVTYLAHAHQRINQAIATKRGLVALREEEAQATIAELLTGGVHNAPRSDGLRPIPSSWDYVPAGRVCTITTGVEDSGNADPKGAYPFFVRGREVLRSRDYLFDTEAVMTPGDGQGGTGKVFHYYDGQFQAHQRVYVLKDFVHMLGRYFFWFMSTYFREHALSQSNTVTMESLRRPVIASFPVALPPIDEQTRIIERIESVRAQADRMIETMNEEITLLEEFRTRLTADVVTGQLDVRSIAASLPPIDLADVFAVAAGADDTDDEETANGLGLEDG